MINAEETKRIKAKALRCKKPIVKNLNLDFIKEDLYEIMEACEEIRWYTDSEDGSDTLINALDSDYDEAAEYKNAFGDLCYECEQMYEDLNSEWIPEIFDIFFVAIGAGTDGLLGWDSYEQDYYGIGCTNYLIEDDMKKKIKKLTKDELIQAASQCFKVYHAYIGLRTRFDSLKAAIDILRDQNTGLLQTIKEIDKLYNATSEQQKEHGEYAKLSKEWKKFEKYTDTLPQEIWIQ